MKSPQLTVLASVYKGEAYLTSYLQQLQEQSLFPAMEIVFVSNVPSAQERNVLHAFQREFPQQVQVLEVPRETLGASWNRAWRAARAPLVAMWNIDDRRLPDSLARQVAALQQHGWDLCYGDYIAVKSYGETDGVRRTTPPYAAGHFARAFAQGGAFWVLRHKVAEATGYFDEQFRVAADMDFSFRMAVKRLPMGRVDGVLGYFTDAEQGLSTRQGGHESAVERTAVQLRYGVFDKVQPELRPAAQRFCIDAAQNFGEWRPLAEFVPGYAALLRSRQPLWIVGRLRLLVRGLLNRLGLLAWVHARLKKEL